MEFALETKPVAASGSGQTETVNLGIEIPDVTALLAAAEKTKLELAKQSQKDEIIKSLCRCS